MADAGAAAAFDPVRFQADFDALKAQVAVMQAQLISLSLPSSASLGRAKSVLEDGTKVDIRPDEVESMRAMFNMFDTNNSGTINASGECAHVRSRSAARVAEQRHVRVYVTRHGVELGPRWCSRQRRGPRTAKVGATCWCGAKRLTRAVLSARRLFSICVLIRAPFFHLSSVFAVDSLLK